MTVLLPRRLALVLGLTQTLAWATTFYLPAVIIRPVAAATGLSPTLLLGGFSWALLVAGLASPRVGRHIEHAGGRGVLALGTTVMAAGLLAMAAAPGLAGWYGGWTVTGVGMALGLYDAAFATIGRLLGQRARPAILGVTMMAEFASSVGWPMGVGLVHLLGWRATLLVDAAIQLGVNLPLLLTLVPRALPATPAAPAAPADPGRRRRGDGRGVLLLLGAFLCLRAAISAIVSVHALTLLRGIGLDTGGAVAVAALFGPFQVLGRIVEWGLGRWLDPLATAILGAVLLPAGVAALLGGAPALVFAAGYGMSNGILTITRGTLPMHLFGAQGYATRLGRLALPQLLAQALAPTMLTPLVLAWPARDVVGGVGAAAVLALAALVGAAGRQGQGGAAPWTPCQGTSPLDPSGGSGWEGGVAGRAGRVAGVGAATARRPRPPPGPPGRHAPPPTRNQRMGSKGYALGGGPGAAPPGLFPDASAASRRRRARREASAPRSPGRPLPGRCGCGRNRRTKTGRRTWRGLLLRLRTRAERGVALDQAAMI